jgi:hypothetical protein
MDLKQQGKLMQDSQRLVGVVVGFLEKANAPGAADFKRLTASMVCLDGPANGLPRRVDGVPAPTGSKSTPSPSLARKQLQPSLYRNGSASMSEADLISQQEKLRRATLPSVSMQSFENQGISQARASSDSVRPESPLVKRESHQNSSLPIPTVSRSHPLSSKPPNLDYLSLSNTPVSSQPNSPSISRSHQPHTMSQYQSNPYNLDSSSKVTTATPTEWEALLGSIDGGQTNIYDAMYGGPPLSLTTTSHTSSSYEDWSPGSWDMASLNMHDFSGSAPPQSVLSFSEESTSSGDDLSASDLSRSRGQDFNQAFLPSAIVGSDSYLLDGLDATFGL